MDSREHDSDSTARRGQPDELITIGKVKRARGLKGAVEVIVLTDFPDRFVNLKEVFLCPEDSPPRLATVSDCQTVSGKLTLTFEGIEDRTGAEGIVGSLLKVSREGLAPLEPDEYYVFDLEGLQVKTEAGEVIGNLTRVMKLGPHDVYVVRNESKDQEFLIPAVKEVVKRVDVKGGYILIDPIEGLLDL